MSLSKRSENKVSAPLIALFESLYLVFEFVCWKCFERIKKNLIIKALRGQIFLLQSFFLKYLEKLSEHAVEIIHIFRVLVFT